MGKSTHMAVSTESSRQMRGADTAVANTSRSIAPKRRKKFAPCVGGNGGRPLSCGKVTR